MGKDRFFFLISLAFLGILAAFLFREPQAQKKPAQFKTQNRKRKIQTTEVMVAEKDLNVGNNLTENTFIWKRIDPQTSDPSFITRNPKIEKWINEAVIVKNVSKGDQIKRLDVMWPQELRNDNANVLKAESGKIAVQFDLKDRDAIVNFMHAGMFADILFTSKSDIGFGTLTLTLLKDILILSFVNSD